MAPDEPLPKDKFGNPYKPGRLTRGRFSAAAVATMAASIMPPTRSMRGDAVDYAKHTSRETLNHPSGSTAPGLRANRKAKRARCMRLRKLRGWH